jgi:hypothetical protein
MGGSCGVKAADAVDPVGPLGLGAPKDGYDREVGACRMARGGQRPTARVVVAVFDGGSSRERPARRGRVVAPLVTWQ